MKGFTTGDPVLTRAGGWVGAVFCVLLLCGCEQRYTKTECRLLYPADVNQAKAQLALEAGQQKIKDNAEMGKIERLCVMGIIGAIIAVVVLVYLKLQTFIFVPVSVIFGTLSGISFIELNSHYPKFLPLAGGVFVLVFAGLAAFYLFAHRKSLFALTEVVGNVEEIKKMGGSVYNENVVSAALAKQLPVTQALVAGIRKKINGAPKIELITEKEITGRPK
jgi:hypothetical protein